MGVPEPGPEELLLASQGEGERGPRAVHRGTALSLSGGGFRAMLFHVGALWRLYETGDLYRLMRISSVSGGSIAAAALGLAWPALRAETTPRRETLEDAFVAPVMRLASRTIDVPSLLEGLLLPGRSVAEALSSRYARELLGARTLQDLPRTPRFVINATNVQSGALWRFSRPYMRDWRVGEVKRPRTTLADAVTASSAFPPVLSPFRLRLDPATFTPASGADLQREPFTRKVHLTDGGVYDNLGLETTFKRYERILVSDAGAKLRPDARPWRNWALHALRVLGIIDDQVRSLRKRALIDAYLRRLRSGAYWGIRTDISKYGLADALPCPHDRTLRLADVPTRLRALPRPLRERLVNWGYAVADAALRRHVPRDTPWPPAAFPYPSSPV